MFRSVVDWTVQFLSLIHILSDSYQRVLQHFPDAKVLGVTATPDRGDMRNLGEYFDSLAYEYTLPKAIKSGYLSPIKALTLPLKIDMSGVGIQAGDFKAGDIGTALDPYLHSIADEMANYCKDRKTVVFLPLVKTSPVSYTHLVPCVTRAQSLTKWPWCWIHYLNRAAFPFPLILSSSRNTNRLNCQTF